MKIINNLDFQLQNTAVCIGKFDGIHSGHRILIEEVKKGGLTPVMFTFHSDKGKRIYSTKEKYELAEKLGIEVLIEIPLDEKFRHQQPIEFVFELLVKRCDAKKVVVGTDFCFGYQRQGNATCLQMMGKQYGFETIVIEKLRQEGEVVSSTRIRDKIRSGKIEEANALLAEPYRIKGIVRKGNQIGRKMKTPTANIVPDEKKELPPSGVYAVKVEVEGEIYCGISNLGVKPTVSKEGIVGLETWLFDVSLDLYGKEITVYFIAFQRREKKFDSLVALQKQIKEDTEMVKRRLDETGKKTTDTIDNIFIR